MNESSTIRVLELYSGIGGMHYAFRESGAKGDIIAAVDINTVANDVYRHNFPEVRLMNRNIESLTEKEIKQMSIDMILMSPPCQPFTRVGLQKDSLDKRSSSLFHILQLIPKLGSLKYILVENVKGFETSESRESLLKCMENSGFQYKELLLSPCQFGIPNTRSRYYLLAKKKGLDFCFDNATLESEISPAVLGLLPQSRHWVWAQDNGVENPRNNRKCYTLDKILEGKENADYLIGRELLQKRAWILDIRTTNDNGSCCFTKAYGHYVEGSGSVYCPYAREIIDRTYNEAGKIDKHSVEAVEILEKLHLRFFSPKEVSRLMCFPETFDFPSHITNRQKYRLLGNSINVHVVSRLIYLLQFERNAR